MSAMQEVKKTWGEKYGSELPSSSFWIEDVRTNLAKHKSRVNDLKISLKEEEHYVEFLESLLKEITANAVENGGKVAPPPPEGGTLLAHSKHESSINDVIHDTLQRRSQNEKILQSPSKVSTCGNVQPQPPVTDANKSLFSGRNPNASPVVDNTNNNNRENDSTNDQEHFVTVIEVNGQNKERKSNGVGGGNKREERRKPVPPIPPPKNTKRASSLPEQPNPPRPLFSSFGHGVENKSPTVATALEAQQKLEEKEEWSGERNVVFDSRSKVSRRGCTTEGSGRDGSGGSSSNSNSSSLSSSASKEQHAQANQGIVAGQPQPPEQFAKPLPSKKKFQGSKLPLPPKEDLNTNGNKSKRKPGTGVDLINQSQSLADSSSLERRSSGRSKISDMIGKLEGNSLRHEQPMMITPKKRSLKDTSSSSHSSANNNANNMNVGGSEALMADYMDPLDAEGVLKQEELYDLPPDSPSSPRDSLEGLSDPEVCQNLHRGNQQDLLQLELEPMYDTVAPDQPEEQTDDDYVVLLDDEATNGNNNLARSSSTHQLRETERNTAERERKADSATIRSQASVVSGHSITTTSSGTTSDTEGLAEGLASEEFQHERGSANYVNLDYFLKSMKNDPYMSESETESDVEPMLHRAMSYEMCESSKFSISSNGEDMLTGSRTNLNKSMEEAPTMRVTDQLKLRSFQSRITTIAISEHQYVEVLNLLVQYMKAMKGTFSTSKPVLSTDDFNIIFYKIPELHAMHQKFLNGLQEEVSGRWEVGRHFETMAKEVDVYGAFLQNYSRAVDTVKKCSQSNAAFAETTRDIRSKTLNISAGVTFETLLHSPVSRVQKNLEIVNDLLRLLPESHPDALSLASAQKLFQQFLSEFKMIQPEQLSEKNARKLVKNSFIVEFCEGNRKLRHLFLFNDVLVCAKYKPSGKKEKFTYELKWHMPIADCLVVEQTEARETVPVNLVALRSRASNVRDQLKRQSIREDKKGEKNRKKLAELESQLVLASPNLILKLKSSSGKSTATFFLSSDYDRSQWIETIETLKKQSALLPATPNLSSNEIQQWITKNRRDLKTNMYMGSYLLRTGTDGNLLIGDFYILIGKLTGIQRPADLFICLEVDSYGHFFRKAKTKMICGSSRPCWNEDYIIELEGSFTLRVLLYEEHPTQGQLIRAAATVELNRSWIGGSGDPTEKTISLQDYTLYVTTRFTPSEMTIRRVPAAKSGCLFGAKITQVCKREKRQVPFIITSCVKEIERRGINEQGIYRVSGSSSDGIRLKKAFDSNCYEAEQLLKEVDINSVASLLKTYLRELPEALFTDELYPQFFDAFSQVDEELKAQRLLQTFELLPPLNQHIIMYLLDHMTRINQHEKHNKMSINNLATVFGPTLLRPGMKSGGNASADLLAASTANCIAQTGILYFFLWRRANKDLCLSTPLGQ